MGTSLTGVNISASYLGLLKSTDSLAISTTAKTITDGAGNDLPIKLSTNQMLFGTGSASVPALSFNGNTSEGFYIPTDENIGVTIAGSEVARFLSTGLSLTSSKLTLSNDQKVRWTSDDVYIQGTTSADNIQLGVGGSTQFTFAQTTGMRLHQYGSGNITGTVTQRLGVTSTGQVVEIPIGGGAVDGSGTAGKIVKWSDTDTITDSVISESSGNIQIQGLLGVGQVPDPVVQLSVNGQIGASNNGNAGAPDFTFYGDDNTGMYRVGADSLGFTTGSTNALTLDASQNATFAGTIQSDDITIVDGTNDVNLNFANTSYGIQLDFSAGDLFLRTNGSSRLTIKNDGSVGIGTTTPQTTFQVNGSASALNAHFGQGQQNSNGVFGGISLGYAETANANFRKVAVVAEALGDSSARQNLHLLVDTASDSGSAVIADSKLKIDGLTGDATFTNNANISGGNLQIGSGHNTASAGNAIIFASYGSGTNIAGGEVQIYGGRSTGSASGGSIKFYTSPSGSSGSSSNAHIQALSIDSSQSSTFAGNVTISQSNSSTSDLINQNTHATGLSRFIAQSNTTDQNAQLVSDDANNISWVGTTTGGTNRIAFINNTNAYYDGGNFGIGLTAPNRKLEVSSGGSDVPQIRASYDTNNYIDIKHDIINKVGGSSFTLQFGGSNAITINSSQIVGMGSTGIYTSGTTAQLNLPSYALAIKNNVSGNNNNWGYIRNTATADQANLEFTSGVGIALTLNHDKTATFTSDAIFGGTSFEDNNSLGRKIEIASANAVGLILNDTRDTHPMAITNDGAVMNLRYNTTAILSMDGASSASTFAGIIGVNGSTTANVPITATTSSGYNDVAYFQSAGTNIDARINLLPTGTANGVVNSTANSLVFQTSGTERVRINSSGNLLLKGTGVTSLLKFDSSSFGQIQSTGNTLYYDIDTQIFRNSAGTSEYARFDSSGNLSIGTTDNNARILRVKGSGDLLQLTSTNAGAGGAQLDLTHESASPADNDVVGIINFTGFDSGSNNTTYASIQGVATSVSSETGALSFKTRTDASTYTEKARIDSSGVFLVGKTSASVATAGIELQPSGFGNFTRASGVSAQFNRTSDDGNVIAILKDGSTTGVIGTQNWGIGTSSPATKLHILEATDRSLSSSAAQMRIEGNGYTAFFGLDDTSFQIGQNSNLRSLTFHSGASGSDILERMRITPSGNVGIGTSTPASKLEIFGSGNTLRLDSSANQSKSILFRNVGSGTAEIKTDGDLKFNAEDSGKTIQFFTVDTERARIDSNGNMGLSNTSMSSFNQLTTQGTAPVFVVGNGTANPSITIFSDNANVGSLSFADGTTTTEQYKGLIQYNHSTNGMSFYTNASERIRITSGGDVGISNTSPSAKLHIGSGSSALISGSADELMVDNAGNSGITIGSGASSVGSLFFADSGSSASGYVQYNHSSNALIMGTEATERMRITSDGRSFFNYSNETISTYGSGAYGGTVVVKAPSGSSNGLAILNESIGGTSEVALNFTNEFVANQYNYLGRIVAIPESSWTGTASTRSSALSFQTNNAGTISEKARLTSGGNFLVNCTAVPDSTVEGFVITGNSSGNRSSSGSATTSYNHLLFYNGNGIVGSISTGGSTTTYSTTSDYRLKEDLQDFNALEIASKIKMYDFKWKADDTRSYGVMAHELQEVVPQAVSGDKDDQYMQQVDYSKLVPILLKSIQELEARVKELEKEI